MPADDFLKAAGDPSLIQDIAPQAATLEGFLFPATYELSRHPAAADLTRMMVRKFRDAIKQIYPEDPAPGVPARSASLLSTVTLASLVERETPKPDERPIVASVYENRLKKRMLLQCDPTVIYALEQTDSYQGTLTLKDLQFASPYNTYLHGGLPPGPIGNPGEASLRAALDPAQTDFLYFVANTQGGHFFAPTLAEHNKNVAKYHRLLKGEPAELPEPPVSKKHAAAPLSQRQTMMDELKTKKNLILEAARAIGVQKWTPAEIDQLRRKLLADHGEEGKTSNDYIADVLKAVGLKVQLTEREEAEERFEEEFEDILHFKTLADAEVSLTRLDELMRRLSSTVKTPPCSASWKLPGSANAARK